MDVSPKTLREVEFREKMRGYHPEDVDQFLERVAAGIEVLQDRLRQAIERAQRAEQAAAEAGGNDDALRRTLLLAQRTADLAVQEAREQAAGIIANAEQQTQAALAEADRRVQSVIGEAEHRARSAVVDAEQRAHSMLADAEQRSQAMVAGAEHRARLGHEDTLVAVRTELAQLEVDRQRLQMDADTLARWVGEHRAQLRAALEDALTRVDQIDLSPPPPVRAPYPLEAPPAEVAPTDTTTAPPGPEQSPEAQPAPSADPQQQARPEPPDNTQLLWAPPGKAPQAVASAAEPVDPWPAEPEAASDETGEADPYFAELRRAISEPDPLAPRPEGESRATGGHAAASGEP